jgi:multiple sugar transport system substrate-binding protein
LILFALVLSACGAPAAPAAQPATDGGPVVDEGQAATVVEAGELVPPVVAEACEGEACFCQDKTVTVIVNTAGEKGPISGPFYEVRDEFQAATGATLEIVEVPFAEHFPKLLTDMTTGTGQYDTSIAGAWWLGDLVGGDYILPLDEYYNDTTGKYPAWDIEDVQQGPAQSADLRQQALHGRQRPRRTGHVLPQRPVCRPGAPGCLQRAVRL